MADETAVPEAPPQDSRSEAMAYVIGVAGWIVPGLGHALLKMWGRAAMCFLTVGPLAVPGGALRGSIFDSAARAASDSLGYVAHLGTGAFSLQARPGGTHRAHASYAGDVYGA